MPLSLQLYTVRELIKTEGYLPIFKKVAEIGYAGVEMGGFYEKTPKEIRKELDDLGLKCTGWWAPYLNPEKRNEILDTCAAIGTKEIMGGYGPKDFESDEQVNKNAAALKESVEFFRSKGLFISLHNHNWEFVNPARYDLLLKQVPKVGLEVDIYWVQVGGGDPAAFIKKYAKRVRFVHAKDGPANKHDHAANMTAVGTGDVATADCIHAAEAGRNLKAVVVELDRCDTDMLQAVKDSYTFLTSKGLAQGKK
jgi:sugar phosphate isomerase/epimerase